MSVPSPAALLRSIDPPKAEGFHSVVETDQTRAFPGIRSADAVIANAHGGSAAQ
jgi:hypothetical protein